MKTITTDLSEFKRTGFANGKLSFRPFVAFLRKKISESKGLQAPIFEYIIEKFEAYPELLEPLDDPELFHLDTTLIDLINLVLFPLASENEKQLYAFSLPFYLQLFHHSQAFEEAFIEDGLLTFNASVKEEEITKNKTQLAYKGILEKFFGMEVDINEEMTYIFKNKKSGLQKYYQINSDSRFIDIRYIGDKPLCVPEKGTLCSEKNKIIDIEQLKTKLPLEDFVFEGFGVISIKDVTQEAALNEMKNIGLKHDATDVQTYKSLEESIKVLLGIRDITVNIFPLLQVNNSYVISEEYNRKTMLIIPSEGNKQYGVFGEGWKKFEQNPSTILVPNLLDLDSSNNIVFEGLLEKQFKGYLMVPIQNQGKLIGILEVASSLPNQLGAEEMNKINLALPILEQAINYYNENFENKIEQLIKEKFTSLQPAVEWKFNEVAWDYLKNKDSKNKQIGNIIFKEVYPLYGAIDIRNSSIERNKALLRDFETQLHIIDATLQHIQQERDLPIIEELAFKNQQFLKLIQDGISPDDEIQLNYFFSEEIEPIFKHLLDLNGRDHTALSYYFVVTEHNFGQVYEFRKAFEDSLNTINTTVSNYLEEEKEKIQQAYPNYFEKYKTDGVEYNIYVGQSICPNQVYNPIYLRNLRLWQLTSMAEITQITRILLGSLPIALETTQLILVHSNSIDISFRKDERRFDTEGAYNLRYEIMKKRIDKALIKGTGERLTQPGKIAIVYGNVKDLDDYLGYIEFLHSKGLVNQEIEYLELEEMQGVYGLKAIRITVS